MDIPDRSHYRSVGDLSQWRHSVSDDEWNFCKALLVILTIILITILSIL